MTITAELHQALVEFRRASGMSPASLVSQLLSSDDVIRLVHAMAESFTVAKKSPSKALELMEGELQRAHVDVAQVQLDLQDVKKSKPLKPRRSTK